MFCLTKLLIKVGGFLCTINGLMYIFSCPTSSGYFKACYVIENVLSYVLKSQFIILVTHRQDHTHKRASKSAEKHLVINKTSSEVIILYKSSTTWSLYSLHLYHYLTISKGHQVSDTRWGITLYWYSAYLQYLLSYSILGI